jgi:hypothetical protein
MDALGRVVRAGARRVRLRRVLSGLMVGAVAGSCVGLGAVLIGRGILAVGSDAALGLGVAPIFVGALAGLGHAVVGLRRVNARLQAATEIDHHLGLKDALGSAVAFSERTRAGRAGPASAFAMKAIEDAERVASRLEARRVGLAVPCWSRWQTRRLWGTLGVAALACGAALLLPPGIVPTTLRQAGLWPGGSAPGPSPERELINATAAELERLRQALEQLQQERPAGPGDMALSEQIAELQRELEAGLRTPESARQEAAARLEEQARAMERELRANQRAADELRARLAAMSASPGPAQPEDRPDPAAFSAANAASQLAEALRAADTAAAAEAARKLQEALDRAPERDRLAAAEELRRLADALEQAGRDRAGSESPGSAEPGAPDQVKQVLESAGRPPEHSSREASTTDPESLQRSLEEAGLDPEAARRLAERAARENERREIQRRADERQRELAERLRDAAREAQPPRDEGRGNGAAPQPAQPSPRSPGSGPESAPSPSAEPSSSGEPVARPEGQPAPSAQPQDSAPRPGQTTPQPSPALPDQTPPDGQPPTPPRGKDESGIKRLQEALERLDSERTPQGSDLARDPGQGGDPQGHSQDTGSPGPSGVEPGMSDEGQPGRDGSGTRALRDLADRISGRRSPPPDQGDARGASEGLPPMSRLPGGVGTEPRTRPQGDGATVEQATGTRVLDARDRTRPLDGRERIAAEWLGPPSDRPDAPRGPGARAILRDAAESARRSIEEGVVPSRFDGPMRAFFDRLSRQVPAGTEAPPAPGPGRGASE